MHPIKMFAIAQKQYLPIFDLGHYPLSISHIGFQTFIPEWNQLFGTGLGQITIIKDGDIMTTTCLIMKCFCFAFYCMTIIYASMVLLVTLLVTTIIILYSFSHGKRDMIFVMVKWGLVFVIK